MTPSIEKSSATDPFEAFNARLDEGQAEASRGARFVAYCQERLAEGGGLAAARAVADMQLDAAQALLGVAKGERDGAEVMGELGSRTRAGLRYESLVQTWGRQLFGSARLAGESVVAEDSHYRLVYIPARAGSPEAPPLFHVGGVLPYGDAFFRLLPEANFYERFTERGLPVYALELKGDRQAVDFQDLTLEGVIDAVSHFSGLAFDHAKGRKMILEGYCGLGAQALSYALARPLEANARFKVVGLFVSPVDGTRCRDLAQIMQLMPKQVLEASYRWAELTGDYIGGDSLRITQDLALKGFFAKTPLGRFVSGWKKPEYAAVATIDDLTPEMRKDLAGAYWISPENCRRWPVPLDLSRFSAGLFTHGVDEKGALPASYHGRPISVADGAQGTRLQFVGFYGGKDALVPDATADVLKRELGERYTHVVHPGAGHVSYVFSRKAWDPANPKGLTPNPVDALLEAYGKAGARANES